MMGKKKKSESKMIGSPKLQQIKHEGKENLIPTTKFTKLAQIEQQRART